MDVDILLLTASKTLSVIMSVGLTAAVLFLIIGLFEATVMKDLHKVRILSIFFAFGILAASAGLLAGISREPAIATILPPAMTLIGGVALFLFSKPDVNSIDVGVAVISFSLFLIFGTVLGSYERGKAEVNARASLFDVDRLSAEAVAEFKVNNFRANLGLEPKDFSEE